MKKNGINYELYNILDNDKIFVILFCIEVGTEIQT